MREVWYDKWVLADKKKDTDYTSLAEVISAFKDEVLARTKEYVIVKTKYRGVEQLLIYFETM